MGAWFEVTFLTLGGPPTSPCNGRRADEQQQMIALRSQGEVEPERFVGRRGGVTLRR